MALRVWVCGSSLVPVYGSRSVVLDCCVSGSVGREREDQHRFNRVGVRQEGGSGVDSKGDFKTRSEGAVRI